MRGRAFCQNGKSQNRKMSEQKTGKSQNGFCTNNLSSKTGKYQNGKCQKGICPNWPSLKTGKCQNGKSQNRIGPYSLS